MWQIDCNKPDAIANLGAEIGKLAPTKGSWEADFAAICTQFHITQCPYIAVRSTERGLVAAVTNCVVDIPNWRALLLSLCAGGNTVLEINCHNVEIKQQHITDLLVAIDTIPNFGAFKLEYSTISEENPSLISDALRALFGGSVEYISLRGCKFGNELLLPALPALSSNINIQYLNLSDNNLSSAICADFVKAMRLNPFIGSISFARNNFSAESIVSLLDISFGTDVSPDDAAFLKKLNSIVNDKNKAIKALNKKKKKGSTEPDLPEFPALPDRNPVAINGKNVVINKTIRTLDFSYNSELNLEGFNRVFSSIRERSDSIPNVSSPLIVIVRGIVREAAAKEALQRQSTSTLTVVA